MTTPPTVDEIARLRDEYEVAKEARMESGFRSPKTTGEQLERQQTTAELARTAVAYIAALEAAVADRDRALAETQAALAQVHRAATMGVQLIDTEETRSPSLEFAGLALGSILLTTSPIVTGKNLLMEMMLELAEAAPSTSPADATDADAAAGEA